MGNHQSNEHPLGESGSRPGSRRGSTRGVFPRTGSGADIQEKEKPQTTSMVTVEKLAKSLLQRSQKEDGVNGVTEKSFIKYLFPMYPELAKHFYKYVHRMGKCKNSHIPLSTFKQQSEKILSTLDDSAVIETYVKMFSSEDDETVMTTDGLRSLLYTSYKLSMDHYPEGPQTCLMVNQTLTAVVEGCFNNKESHSLGFVVRWLEEHCHRLIFPVHRYCVHTLATRHRDMEAASASPDGSGAGLELATPVLDRSAWRAGSRLLPLSAAWLLCGVTPPLYSPRMTSPNHAGGTGGVSAAAAWLARLVCQVPSHWVPLYDSQDHGMGANRFLHHCTAYRGPSLALIQGGPVVIVLACPVEWKESHQYFGTQESVLMQILPTFNIVERGGKMIFLNTSIRGYPKGLRAGTDPKKPILIINPDFDQVTFQGVPYRLDAIEVWGCGDQASRESQLDVKKWQVKEAERQRTVKLSAADWMDHPDRYLLELAGRPQYNNS